MAKETDNDVDDDTAQRITYNTIKKCTSSIEDWHGDWSWNINPDIDIGSYPAVSISHYSAALHK